MDPNVIGEIVRAVVRPIVTIYLVGVCGFLWVKGVPVPGELLTLATGLVSYWFGERFMAKQNGKEPSA